MISAGNGILKYKKDPKVTLLYPPNQSWPGTMCKPNGSMAYPSLGAALMEHGIEVEIFDACVGNDKDDLEEMFYRSTPLPNGLLRTGVREDRILEEVEDSDVVGLTSIFTDQETMVIETVQLIKKHFPDKLILTGGVNARNRIERFLDNGVDLICLSESEGTIQKIMDQVSQGNRDFSGLSSIAFKTPNGKIIVHPTQPREVVLNLDDLPIPAWHLLPNDRYWKIGRPHGGYFRPDEDLRYASMVTSLGCVFQCLYCHIGGETVGSASGPIGRFRVKSDARVMKELNVLKKLGVKQVFLEDDTLFGNKRRGIRLLRKIRDEGVAIIDVNGLNLVHLFRNNEPDDEILEALRESGFREIVVAFESGSQRIIRKYASNKWNVEKMNVAGLIDRCKQLGMRIAGNYMIGFPDETRKEIDQTVKMARRHRQDGLDSANFFIVIPLPGTPLFDIVVQEGYLAKDFDPDRMTWLKGSMINTAVPRDELEIMRRRVWEEINDSGLVKYKHGMDVAEATVK